MLEGQKASNNGSGVTGSDCGRPAVISADDNHHANAGLAQWKCFEDSGLAERRFHNDHNDHGDCHASCRQSPTDDPPPLPLRTSEDPDDAQGTSPTVVSPYGQARTARLSSAADDVPTESPVLPDDNQTSAEQVSLPDESPADIESQSPLNPARMHRDVDGISLTDRACAEVSHSSSLHVSFEDETSLQSLCRGPQTRGKATSRQTRLTDCFSRTGIGARRGKRADGQPEVRPHSKCSSTDTSS